MKHTIVLEFSTDKPVPELLDLIAGRVYTLDNVVKGNVTATTMENYLHDIRQRLDVQALPVRNTAEWLRGIASKPRHWSSHWPS